MNSHIFADDILISSSWLFHHVAFFSRLISKHYCAKTVHYKVYKQKVSYFKRLFHSEERGDSTYYNRSNIYNQLELTELKDIVIDSSTIEYSILYRSEVVIKNYYLTCFLGSLCTVTHSKSYICSLKCR